jgi:hypothetical protein
MGAALTYARRYALFAPVGIAGEDDLDAPDLNVPAPAEALRMGEPDERRAKKFQAEDPLSGYEWIQRAMAVAQYCQP